MNKTDARQIFTPFSGITRMTLAQILRARGIRLKAHPMLAFMILTRRSLRIHHRNHIVTLTVFSRKIIRTLTYIVVDTIHTCAAILTQMILTVIDVITTIDTMKAGQAFAAVVCIMIQTLGSICAGIVLFAAEINFGIAKFSGKAGSAFAGVRLDAINAGGIILTLGLAETVVNVRLTTYTGIAGGAQTTETSLF